MNLYLVQHAQAKSKEEDPERPLSDKGRNHIKKVAKHVAANCEISINKICHSGKLRAAQTAAVLAESLGVSSLAKVEGLKPLDEPDIWLDKLNRENEDLMLVGHLPHMAKLATALLCDGKENSIIDFQMGGILALKKEDAHWSVQWMVVPEILS